MKTEHFRVPGFKHPTVRDIRELQPFVSARVVRILIQRSRATGNSSQQRTTRGWVHTLNVIWRLRVNEPLSLHRLSFFCRCRQEPFLKQPDHAAGTGFQWCVAWKFVSVAWHVARSGVPPFVAEALGVPF